MRRLRELRHASREDGVSPEDQRHGSALVYRALARGLNSAPTDSDLTTDQLRAEFARGGLLLTNRGWLSPRGVLAGPPIFGDLRAFAPPIRDCEPLWRALRLGRPSPDDCLGVLRQIAHRRKHAPDATEEPILLETLLALAEHHARGDTVEGRKLAALSLWTTQGWTRDRPVYGTDDPVLAAGLGVHLPIWRPGGGLEQFRSLLKPLRVTEIQAREARVIDPEFGREDHDLTELFRRALALLREDLQRNDARLAEGLTMPWASLAAYVVTVHPPLALAVEVASGQEYECDVNAKVDTTLGTVFVTEPAVLARVDGGGRALAALFKGGTRLVAQAWRAACDQAEDGTESRPLELAGERAEREEAELDADRRLAELQERTARKPPASRGTAGPGGGQGSAILTSQKTGASSDGRLRLRPPSGHSWTLNRSCWSTPGGASTGDRPVPRAAPVGGRLAAAS